MVLIATYSIQAAGELEPGEICVCIPFINLELAIQKLSSQTRFAVIQEKQTEQQKAILTAWSMIQKARCALSWVPH